MNKKITSPGSLLLILILFCVFSVLGILYLIGWDVNADFGKWKKAFEIMTGFWLSLVMMAAILPALRIPYAEKLFGGLSEGYRWHRWLGIASAVFLALHWAAARGPKWATALGLMESSGGRPHHKGSDIPPEWWETLFGYMKDMGEWLGYAMIILLILALFCSFIRQNTWIKWHRFFGVVSFLGAVHGIGAIPSSYYASWVMLLTLIITVLCAWQLTKQDDLDLNSIRKALVMNTKLIDKNILEVCMKLPGSTKIAPSQFVCLAFDKKEHPHPFTVINSKSSEKETEFHVLIKGLGQYTNSLLSKVLDGAVAYFQGPYGRFMQDTEDKPQLWICGGVGITPFLSAMQKKAPQPTVLIWSARSPSKDLRQLVEEGAQAAGVKLCLIDTGNNQRLGKSVSIQSLVHDVKSCQCWYCGPDSLLKTVESELSPLGVKVNAEHFKWR